MEIDKTSRFLREDGVYATPQYESDLPLKVIGGEVNMLSNAKPLFLDETGKSINASLQKIANAIKSGGGGGGGDVPTKLSELENDVGFITNSASDLTNYYNKTQADFLLEGKVSTEPGKSLSTNDYTTEDKNKLRDLTQVTESTVSDWGFTKNTGTYSKPSDGIPKSDLNAEVQTSLSKADTALQTHQDISGKADKVANATSGHLAALDLEGNLTDSGSKPSDFASATEQTELKENLIELEQKAITSTEEESYEPTVPRDADTLGGRITAEDIDELGEWVNIGNVAYTQKGTYTLPSIDEYRTLMIIPCAMQGAVIHMNTPFIIPTSVYRQKFNFEFNSWSTGQWRFFTRIRYVSDTSFEVTEYEAVNYSGIRLFFLGIK